ncbi:MAG TPA: hypothetical protein VF170_05295, partial [Planctomycetaceae bacterium]
MSGEGRPDDPGQAATFAGLFAHPRQRHALAARLYGDAFRRDPGLAADLGRESRYTAGRCAVLAAAG